MKIFEFLVDVPVSFSGECYVKISKGVFCFLNGNYHNEYGPAIVYDDGIKFWYINDEEYTEEQFLNHPLVIQHKLSLIDSLSHGNYKI